MDQAGQPFFVNLEKSPGVAVDQLGANVDAVVYKCVMWCQYGQSRALRELFPAQVEFKVAGAFA